MGETYMDRDEAWKVYQETGWDPFYYFTRPEENEVSDEEKKIKCMMYHFKTHKGNKGFWAECCELEGCVTQAATIEELYLNCKEALNLYLDEPNDTKIVFPLPDDSLDNDNNLIKIEVEPEIALAVLLRTTE